MEPTKIATPPKTRGLEYASPSLLTRMRATRAGMLSCLLDQMLYNGRTGDLVTMTDCPKTREWHTSAKVSDPSKFGGDNAKYEAEEVLRSIRDYLEARALSECCP